MTFIRYVNGTGIRHTIRYNYPEAWHFKNREYYKVGYPIDNKLYFVKRYVGKTPSGKDLILALAGKSMAHLPFIYDLVEQQDGHQNCQYYISSLIEGNTLDKFITKKSFISNLDLHQLATQLLRGLNTLYEHQFWFGDFNEQNIMYSTIDKSFYFIDLDSCWAESIAPNGVERATGGLPALAQGYASTAISWLRQLPNMESLEIDHLNGKTVNYLQLLVLISRLKYFKEAVKTDSTTEFSQTVQTVLAVAEDLSAALPLFGQYFKRQVGSQTIDDSVFMAEFDKILAEVINREVGTPKPRILKFSIFPSTLKLGEEAILKWETKHTNVVKLLGGQFGSAGITQSSDGNISIQPKADTDYTLQVFDNQGNTNTLKASILIDKSVEPIEIIAFRVNRTHFAADTEHELHVIWWVKNAEKVFFNGEIVKEHKGHKTMVPKENTTLKLLARNGEFTPVVREIEIEVAKKKMPVWAKAAMIAIPLLIGSFWFGKELYINQLSPSEAFQKGQQAFKNNDFTAALPYLKRAEAASNKQIGNALITQAGALNSTEQADCYYYMAKSCIELKQETDACQWVEEGLKKSQSNALMELCVYNKCNCTVNATTPKPLNFNSNSKAKTSKVNSNDKNMQ